MIIPFKPLYLSLYSEDKSFRWSEPLRKEINLFYIANCNGPLFILPNSEDKSSLRSEPLHEAI